MGLEEGCDDERMRKKAGLNRQDGQENMWKQE